MFFIEITLKVGLILSRLDNIIKEYSSANLIFSSLDNIVKEYSTATVNIF